MLSLRCFVFESSLLRLDGGYAFRCFFNLDSLFVVWNPSLTALRDCDVSLFTGLQIVIHLEPCVCLSFES